MAALEWLSRFRAMARYHRQRPFPVRRRRSHRARCFRWLTMCARSRITRCRFRPWTCEKKQGSIESSDEYSRARRAGLFECWMVPSRSKVRIGTRDNSFLEALPDSNVETEGVGAVMVALQRFSGSEWDRVGKMSHPASQRWRRDTGYPGTVPLHVEGLRRDRNSLTARCPR